MFGTMPCIVSFALLLTNAKMDNIFCPDGQQFNTLGFSTRSYHHGAPCQLPLKIPVGKSGHRILQWPVVIASADIHIAVFKDTNYLKSLLLFGQYPSSPHSSWGIVTHGNTAPFAQLAVVAVSAVYQTAVYQTDPVFRNRPRHLLATELYSQPKSPLPSGR